MRSKHLPLWVRALSTVFLIVATMLFIPGILWVIDSSGRLNDADARIAPQPFKRIQLHTINQGLISVMLMIPNTKQWTKIRKIWGEPEFVISAVDTTGESVLCLPAMPVRIELTDSSGKTIPLHPGGGPYGYSSSCASSSLRFHAPPGSDLMLKLSPIRLGGTVPATDLMIVSDWFDTKDKILTVEIDKSIEALIKRLSIPSFLLAICGAAVFIANRIRITRQKLAVSGRRSGGVDATPPNGDSRPCTQKGQLNGYTNRRGLGEIPERARA